MPDLQPERIHELLLEEPYGISIMKTLPRLPEQESGQPLLHPQR